MIIQQKMVPSPQQKKKERFQESDKWMVSKAQTHVPIIDGGYGCYLRRPCGTLKLWSSQGEPFAVFEFR